MFRSLYILYSLPSNPTANWLGKNMILALAFFLVILRELQLQIFRHFLSRAVEELNKIIELSRSEKQTWCTINECY